MPAAPPVAARPCYTDGMTARAWRLAPTLIALAAGVAFLTWEPRPGDLAAHTFRAELFGREGFTIWNGQWYGGHHTPAYSVLSPPLAWLLTPALALVASAVASAALFEPLARGWVGPPRSGWRRCLRCSGASAG